MVPGVSAKSMKELEERRASLGALGMAFKGEGLPYGNPLVHTGLFDGGCECIHFIWWEPGIKYLLQEGMPRKREAH